MWLGFPARMTNAYTDVNVCSNHAAVLYSHTSSAKCFTIWYGIITRVAPLYPHQPSNDFVPSPGSPANFKKPGLCFSPGAEDLKEVNKKSREVSPTKTWGYQAIRSQIHLRGDWAILGLSEPVLKSTAQRCQQTTQVSDMKRHRQGHIIQVEGVKPNGGNWYKKCNHALTISAYYRSAHG